MQLCSAATAKLDSQPKALALSEEGTAFVAEGKTVEAIRNNQTVVRVSVKYEANGIATTGKVVAIGGDVSFFLSNGDKWTYTS